jgi:hypothetical protein
VSRFLRKSSAMLALLVLSGLVIAPLHRPANAADLQTTEPGHMNPPPQGAVRGFAPPPAPSPSTNVVAWFNGSPASTTVFSQSLTDACRASRFNERIPLFYRAIFYHSGVIMQALGWGRSGQANLYDPDNLAKDGINYYFEGDRTRSCRVYFLPD